MSLSRNESQGSAVASLLRRLLIGKRVVEWGTCPLLWALLKTLRTVAIGRSLSCHEGVGRISHCLREGFMTVASLTLFLHASLAHWT